MKKRVLIYFVGAFTVFFASCDDKKSSDSELDLKNPTFAPKTVAETKSDLENSGIQMVGELKSLNQEKGMQASIMFVTLMDQDNSGYATSFKKTGPYKLLLGLTEGIQQTNVKKVHKSLLEGDEIDQLLEVFDELKGVYDYDFNTGSFSEEPTEPSDKIIFRFPSNKENYDAQNLNASLEIPRPEVVTGQFTTIDATTLPSNISFQINVDGSTAFSFSFIAQYQPDGIPTSVETTLSMGTWQMKQTYSYSKTQLSINFSFTHGTTNLISFGATVKGNISEEGVQNAFDSTYVEIYPGHGYWEHETHFEKVINSANAYFQLMDIKMMGEVDFLNLIPIVNDEKNSNEQKANAINQYAAFVVVYASNNQAIAKAEAVVVTEEDEWGNNKSKIDMNLVFADKSKSSLDSYFNDGFSDLVNELNSLIDELNQTYGWEVEYIENNSEE